MKNYPFYGKVIGLFLSISIVFSVAIISVDAGVTYYEVMTVGDTKTLSFTNSRSITSTAWTSNRPWDVVITSQAGRMCWIRADSSFSGYAIVQCYYAYVSGTYTLHDYVDYYITVNPRDPTDISVTPINRVLDIGDSFKLTPVIMPSNAQTTLTWSTSNASVATVSDGTVKAADAGVASITVKTSNNLSAVCQVTVLQPEFDVSESVPFNNQDSVSVNVAPCIKYSLPIYQHTQYSGISLINKSTDEIVQGAPSINGKTLSFTPDSPLNPNTEYQLTVPPNAVRNQYGTPFTSITEIDFTTEVLSIIDSTPKNNSEKVPLNQIFDILFSENIKAGSNFGGIMMTKTDTGDPVPSVISLDGDMLRVAPNENLEYLTKYSIIIPENALSNSAGVEHRREDTLRFLTVDSPLALVSSTPASNAEGVSRYIRIVYTFNTAIQQGESYADISLTRKEGGSIIPGEARIIDGALHFLPDEPLENGVIYEFTIPRRAVEGIYSGPNTIAITQSFKTIPKASKPVASPDGGLVTDSDIITLTAFPKDASIYYTLDGSTPTSESELYENPIPINKSLTLRAIALREGYEDSDMLAAVYEMSTLKLISSSPVDGEAGVPCDGVVSLVFNEPIRKGSELGNISLINNKDGAMVPGESIISKNTLYFVSDAPLNPGISYSFSLPEGALKNYSFNINKLHTQIFMTSRQYPEFSAGKEHSALLKTDGSLWSFGKNNWGQLGDGTSVNKKIPTQIPGTWRSISAGVHATVAIKSDDSLWTWGWNTNGRLGDGTTANKLEPVRIMEDVLEAVSGYNCTWALKADGSLYSCMAKHTLILEDVASVTRGVSQVEHTAAIKTDATLWIWGANNFGQIGGGYTSTSTVTPGARMSDVATCTAGDSYTMALKTDGGLWAWGKNNAGQLGIGSTSQSSSNPTKILSDVIFASAGEYHAMAIKKDGSLWGWGNNDSGQLGNSSTVSRSSPTKIMDDVISVSAGGSHTLALKSDGSLWAWGNNSYGQLGDGTTTARTKPVEIIGAPPVAEGITFNKADMEIPAGRKDVLIAEINPSGAKYDSVIWSSDNTNVATVSQRGVVTAIASGTAEITANVNGLISTCEVTVTEAESENPSIAESFVSDGTKAEITLSRPLQEGEVMVIAFYKEGRLLGVIHPPSEEVGKTTVVVNMPGASIYANADKVKIMMLEGYNNIKPICESKTLLPDD